MPHYSPKNRALTLLFLAAFILPLILSALSWATEVINYSYDKDYQVTAATFTGSGTYDYVYDPAGNRLTAATLG